MDTTENKPTATAAPAAAKPAARRKAAPRRKSARPAVSKEKATPRKGARPVAGARKGPDLWTDLVAGRASAAGARIAKLSKKGATSARRALENVKGLSKKTARRLARDWQKMDGRRRVQLVATLAAALGAAALPIAARQLKKR